MNDDQWMPSADEEVTGNEPRYVYQLNNREMLERGNLARQVFIRAGYRIEEFATKLPDTSNRKDATRYTMYLKWRGATVKKFEDMSYPYLVGAMLYQHMENMQAQREEHAIANDEYSRRNP